MVTCPICDKPVKEVNINRHIDSGCVDLPSPPPSQSQSSFPKASQAQNFFKTPAKKVLEAAETEGSRNSPAVPVEDDAPPSASTTDGVQKRTREPEYPAETDGDEASRKLKRVKVSNLEKVAPLAERMRPRTLDEVHGQELVGPHGILRSLIESDRVPSMVLWGGPGTGKTTIARLIAQTAGTRFVEINSTSTGVGECKKLFTEARNELNLTGRKTIIFCDEIHRFSKSQQDVFLGPVEAGTVVLIGATTENPSFKVINALLSRCRVFTLAKLTDNDIQAILKRALVIEPPPTEQSKRLLEADDHDLLHYLSTFADGDARTALNLLSLALDLSSRLQPTTADDVKRSLTQTLVYDRAGDQHYDTISAFHKSVRGSDPDAALYYLARMLQSGEDALFIARRMVVIASEDVGLADNTLLPLATAAYNAAEKIGMPECRINLAHCCVALCLAPKSTRSYRALNNAYAALAEPGIAGLPIPLHIRNAPTRLMKEMQYGLGYKYNPDYVDGEVVQDYLPDRLKGRRFLEGRDLGTQVDPEVVKRKEGELEARKKAMTDGGKRHEREHGRKPEQGEDVDGADEHFEGQRIARHGDDELIMHEDEELYLRSEQ